MKKKRHLVSQWNLFFKIKGSWGHVSNISCTKSEVKTSFGFLLFREKFNFRVSKQTYICTDFTVHCL